MTPRARPAGAPGRGRRRLGRAGVPARPRGLGRGDPRRGGPAGPGREHLPLLRLLHHPEQPPRRCLLDRPGPRSRRRPAVVARRAPRRAGRHHRHRRSCTSSCCARCSTSTAPTGSPTSCCTWWCRRSRSRPGPGSDPARGSAAREVAYALCLPVAWLVWTLVVRRGRRLGALPVPRRRTRRAGAAVVVVCVGITVLFLAALRAPALARPEAATERPARCRGAWSFDTSATAD